MFNSKTRNQKTPLEEARDAAVARLTELDPMDADYAEIRDSVKELSNLVAAEQAKRERLNPNTVLIASANVAVALVVVGYESRNVITTKALSFLVKAS